MTNFDMFCPAPTFIPFPVGTPSGIGGWDGSFLTQTSGKSLGLTSALLVATLLGETANNVEGFISNVSVGSSVNWYLKLTYFETLFLGLIMLQIVILRYLEVLPINLNNLFVHDPSGRRRRKRRSAECEPPCNEKDKLAENVFSLLRKLDDQDCLLKSLCEIQANSLNGHPTPKNTKRLMAALTMSGRRRRMEKDDKTNLELSNNKNYPRRSGMEEFEQAVLSGHDRYNQVTLHNDSPELEGESENSIIFPSKNRTMTLCDLRYQGCLTPSEDIIYYFNIISEAGMI